MMGMTTTRKYLLRSTFAAAALAAGLATVSPAIAAAEPAPTHPLVETTCSFAQIDAALHVVAPDFASRLDANPERKAQVEEFFSLPVDQRQGTLDAFLANNPGIADRAGEFDNANAKALEVAQTCQNY